MPELLVNVVELHQFNEKDHVGIVELITNFENMFFNMQREQLNMQGIFIFNPLPAKLSKSNKPEEGYYLVSALPNIKTDEDKVAWGGLWKAFLGLDGFVAAFQITEGYVTQIDKEENVKNFKEFVEQPSNKMVRREALCFIAQDNTGWTYTRYTPFIRPEIDSLPIRVYSTITHEDIEIEGTCIGD